MVPKYGIVEVPFFSTIPYQRSTGTLCTTVGLYNSFSRSSFNSHTHHISSETKSNFKVILFEKWKSILESKNLYLELIELAGGTQIPGRFCTNNQKLLDLNSYPQM